MGPVLTDGVAWFVSSWSLIPVIVNPAKMAKPIEMPFELRTQVDPMKHILDGVHIGATWQI